MELVEIPDMESMSSSLTRHGAWNLYISHALSTWNVRTYEFAAVGLPFSLSPSGWWSGLYISNISTTDSFHGICVS